MQAPYDTKSALDCYLGWASEARRRDLQRALEAVGGRRYRELRDRTGELLEALNDPATPADELARRIEAEPDLALYLRERANRPFFGAVSCIHAISEILLLLGREKVGRLVLAQGLRRALEPETMAGRRLAEQLWKKGRKGAEQAVRVGVEVAQRRDGGVVDVRSLDLVYGRSLFAPLGAVLALYLGDRETTLQDEPELGWLSVHELAALLVHDWGASAALASDLALLSRPDEVEDRIIDLIVVGQALAESPDLPPDMPPSVATIERLGFDAADWPRLWSDS